ncbi:MAG TPA: hypothetical protein H9782_10970 [Candidatus Bariatricus faecipullorum]|nr:hypothetical protein [Candidatus Bariatricus faecipullorum]
MLDRRYEQQMDKKEKRQFEKEKLKEMSGRQKLEYLWMYYKVWLLVPIGIALLVWVGVTMYRSKTEEVLLNVVVADGIGSSYDEVEQELKDRIQADGNNQTVKFNNSLSAATYQGEMAFTTLVAAESIDVVVCPEEFYEEYQDVMGEPVILEAGEWMAENLGIPYETVYVGIVENAPNRENAEVFVEILQEYAE